MAVTSRCTQVVPPSSLTSISAVVSALRSLRPFTSDAVPVMAKSALRTAFWAGLEIPRAGGLRSITKYTGPTVVWTALLPDFAEPRSLARRWK